MTKDICFFCGKGLFTEVELDTSVCKRCDGIIIKNGGNENDVGYFN